MKRKMTFVILVVFFTTVIAGCIGQGGTPRSFKTLGDAYNSNMSLMCQIENENSKITYYFGYGNIRTEIEAFNITTYSIIAKSDDIYVWSSKTPKVNHVPGIGAPMREGAMKTPFDSVKCYEQPVPESMFMPPEQG